MNRNIKSLGSISFSSDLYLSNSLSILQIWVALRLWISSPSRGVVYKHQDNGTAQQMHLIEKFLALFSHIMYFAPDVSCTSTHWTGSILNQPFSDTFEMEKMATSKNYRFITGNFRCIDTYGTFAACPTWHHWRFVSKYTRIIFVTNL